MAAEEDDSSHRLLDYDSAGEQIIFSTMEPISITAQPPAARRQRCSKTRVLIAVALSCAVIASVLLLALLLKSHSSVASEKEVVCSPNVQWRCSNHLECIEVKQICNGIEDCSDLSDEVGCPNGCKVRNAFHCSNGNCIKKEWQCDRQYDCPGRDDEINCDLCNRTTQFTCRNYDCISIELLCDGIFNCKDQSDESNCFHNKNGVVQFVANGTLLDVCYNEHLNILAGRICAYLGSSSSDASVTSTERNSSLPSLHMNSLEESYAGGLESYAGGLAVVASPPCSLGVRVSCSACGSSTKQLWVSSLVGGQSGFPISDYPWHVKVTSPNGLCGGSIISTSKVLTAAHCVDGVDAQSITVTMGTNKYSGEGGLTRSVLKALKHPEFYSTKYQEFFTTYNNDLAILDFEPITVSESIAPVCLPMADEIPSFKSTCYITGFGAITRNPLDGFYPQQLNEGKIKVFDKAICQNIYAQYRLNITSDWLCAGYNTGGIDSCQGDSGGPLVCLFSNRWVLVGVTSWGMPCLSTQPSIYSLVTAALPWLNGVILNTP